MRRPIADIDLRIAERFRILRTINGISQKQMGEIIGVSFQQIQKYENGINRVSLSNLMDLCKIFNISMDYFFDKDAEEDVSFVLDKKVLEVVRKIQSFPKPLKKIFAC